MTQDFLRRAQEYKARGYDPSHAFQLAMFDVNVEHWPKGWGNDFVALIFGDFDPPDDDLVFNQLGVTIERERVDKSVVHSARTVLRARVVVGDKSVAAVKDAARRLNLLVGVLSYTNQGAPIRWWSYITSPSAGGIGFKLGDKNPDSVLALVQLLPQTARRKVTAALYWIREPRNMLLEHDRADQLAVYAGYWNAFECLVDAADILQPRPGLTRSEKEEIIQSRIDEISGPVGPGDIDALYRQVVNPGLRAKAEYAIGLCTTNSSRFVSQCFDHEPSDQRLYRIRNAINHGTVDIDDPETRIMIEARFPELWGLVFSMLTGVLQLNLKKVVAS